MKTERSIFFAFILNLVFSIFEFIGGVVTGSVAIISDAIHDVGDAISIGISWFFEKKSKKQPDEIYTYGYARFSAIGSIVTSVFLLIGSGVVIYHGVERILYPAPVHYDGMILFAVIGVCINCGAMFITREGKTLNQKAINLHMLEDVLGWIVILIGAIMMRFTDWAILDSVISIGIAGFITVSAVKNLYEVLCLLLEKVPCGIEVKQIKEHVSHIEGVLDVHHMHIWSLDGSNHFATMHIVTNAEPRTVKEAVRAELEEHGIGHVTLELETQQEHCHLTECHMEGSHHIGHHHHHH